MPLTLHLPTPPGTERQKPTGAIKSSTPESPTQQAHKTSCSEPEIDDWKSWPVVQYTTSRQLQGFLSDSDNSSAPGPNERTKNEPLFMATSPSPISEDHTIHGEGTDDEITFLGSAASRKIAQASNKGTKLTTKRQQPPIPTSAKSVSSIDTIPSAAVIRKRKSQIGDSLDNDSDTDEDISFVGRSYKHPRREATQDLATRSREDTPLQMISHKDNPVCGNCGSNPDSQSSAQVPRGRGTGSSVLSATIRGNITALLMNQEQSLFNQLKSDPRIQDWKDIAQMVGAQREDFDRVRHAAKWLQDNLPGLVARGQF
ncbi:uncharacterized protein L201_002479 [Kwoniella dendrophila CBS 6074]|uniref:Myb-like domain-containing protein n=1 Tax=Kwoniella dendrophila CBS 6074 TaxID=1295534 RepID=A0AAX4JRS2_9TREE